MNYKTFLQTKEMVAPLAGMTIDSSSLRPHLYDFQRAIVRWALKRGRAAVFADCGLGKTLIQLEWLRHAVPDGGTSLIFAPLCVAEQTIEIASGQLGLTVNLCRTATDLRSGLNIANYEMAHKFIDAPLDALVLDESSILKSIDGATRKLLLEHFTSIPFRLCCTATPCPNDIAEIANHAEFLGVMKRVEMLAAFFVHDAKGWRLRGHAREPFYRWLASWAMSLQSPADLGYDASRFILPPLEISDVRVRAGANLTNDLFGGLKGISDRARVRAGTIKERVEAAAAVVRAATGSVIIWCGLNSESKAITTALGDDAVEIEGTQSADEKTRRLHQFLSGEKRILVTKVKIAGFGLNLQIAATMIFLGLNDSYEMYYQAIRRSWRYGQTAAKVRAIVVVTEHEYQIVENVRRKEREAETLSREIVEAAKGYEIEELHEHKAVEVMEQRKFEGADWKLYQGDCIETMRALPTDSVDLSVFSPPFASLYTYSASSRDLGNSRNHDEFFEHFSFVITELLRITKPGRNAVVHIAQSPTTLVTDGMIGLKDLRGRAVEEFVKGGWVYHGEVVIDKDPQAQAIRTHAKGLLFVQLKKDASWLRPALADYLLVFRKDGDNARPIQPDITNEEWIEWARPIWYGIKESDTLNTREARENQDDRHICPLQLGVIERAIRLWSNKGETVFSPFAGIGSEGYVALQQGRRFIGCELKPRYAEVAVRNLGRALAMREQQELFA